MKLALSLLVLVFAVPASGCFLSNNTRGGDLLPGELDVEWDLRDADGAYVCDPDDVVAVIATPTAGGAPFLNCVPCDDGGTVIPPLPSDIYDVVIQLQDVAADCNDEDIPLAESDVEFDVDVRDVGAVLDVFRFPVDVAFFEMQWSFPGSTLADGCAALGAASFFVQPRSGGDVFDGEFFDCERGAGRTSGLPFGTYTLAVDLLDGDDISVLVNETTIPNQRLLWGNHNQSVTTAF